MFHSCCCLDCGTDTTVYLEKKTVYCGRFGLSLTWERSQQMWANHAITTVEHTKGVEKVLQSSVTSHQVTVKHWVTQNGHQKRALSYEWMALVAMQLGNYDCLSYPATKFCILAPADSEVYIQNGACRESHVMLYTCKVTPIRGKDAGHRYIHRTRGCL